MAIDNFPAFAKIVAQSFQEIVAGDEAYVIDIDGDAVYELYLRAFPEGTNPKFKIGRAHV